MTAITLKEKVDFILPELDERVGRKYLAVESLSLGHGGVKEVSDVSGVSRSTIHIGIKELNDDLRNAVAVPATKNKGIRKPGGGRKPLVEIQKNLLETLEGLVNPHTRGDPCHPLIWTSKSVRHLEKELNAKGFKVGFRTVGNLLHQLGYSLQANQKVNGGGKHIDRNAQFEYINNQAVVYQNAGDPVISVDCKKKELIGEYKNSGQEWEQKGDAPKVNVYDFPDKEKGKAAPYGIYDIANNEGFVNVGISHDTAVFAVSSIKGWWEHMGKQRYPLARRVYITADGGGSNGSKTRLWKQELEKFAKEAELEIRVSHFPPGTSKWNKIEHRLFSALTMNWRAKPLVSLQSIVNLIAATTNDKGLKVKAVADETVYITGLKVTDEDHDMINIKKEDFHGEWNYVINST
jgi:transposase